MVRLKEYVDFIVSLTEMDEAKSNKFVLPTKMEFNLEMMNHREIHKEVKQMKEQDVVLSELVEPFEIDIIGVTLKFIHDGYED